MPRMPSPATADTVPLHWLPLCPLLPACTGPVTGSTLMLAAALTALVADLGQRAPDRGMVSTAPTPVAVILAAGMAGLIDLLLRAAAPPLHAQVAAALPLLVLVGLLPSVRSGDRPSRLQGMLPVMLLVLAFACLHALVQRDTLAAELGLLSATFAGDQGAPGGLPWRSPAASLIGLALLLAALNAGRAGVGRGRAL